MEEPVTGSSSAGEMEGSAVDSRPLATAGQHASGDIDATATQAKAEDAGEAEGIIHGWSGVGTSGDRKMVRKAQTWTIGWARGQKLAGMKCVMRKFLIRSIARST